MAPSTHTAIATVELAKLSAIQVPTPKPEANEVRVINYWTSSTPLDLHQNDGHLLVTPPQVLGDSIAGEVVEVGSEVKRLKVGDKVFGFTWRNAKEKAHQEYIVTTENLLGVIPSGFTMQQAVTVPDNFVTILNVYANDFGMEIPWPKPVDYKPRDLDEPVLIWGGSSSTGMYAIQVLKWLGYTNIIAVASAKHHQKLKNYGASECFDYRNGTEEAVRKVIEFESSTLAKPIKYVLDCIGSLEGSVRPVSKIAKKGAVVAVLLPVIVRDAAEGVVPEYSFDVPASADWADGVEARGVRTHFYLDNALLAEKAQAEIMPEALRSGIIEPNEQIVVDGETLLDRAMKAMSMLRNKVASGQRLVWKVADEVKA